LICKRCKRTWKISSFLPERFYPQAIRSYDRSKDRQAPKLSRVTKKVRIINEARQGTRPKLVPHYCNWKISQDFKRSSHLLGSEKDKKVFVKDFWPIEKSNKRIKHPFQIYRSNVLHSMRNLEMFRDLLWIKCLAQWFEMGFVELMCICCSFELIFLFFFS
jgi:hypothetical protein